MLKAWKQKLFFYGSILLTAGFVFQVATPFFLSFGTLFIGISALLLPKEIRFDKGAFAIVIIWLLTLIGGIYSEDKANWGSITSRQLSLLLIPLGFMAQEKVETKAIARSFIYFLSFFALISLFRYLLHFHDVNDALLESGSIPIWDGKSWPWILTQESKSKFFESGISHIYFSVLQAIAIFICCFYWLTEGRKKFWLFFGILHLLIIHWFSARTGLLGLYGALAFVLLHQAVKAGKTRWLLWSLLPLILFPLFSYFLLDAVKNKVKNTMEDIETVSENKDINHRSFAMRLEAWKTALHIIARKPLAGVGSGDVQAEMQKQYEQDHTSLFRKNRIPPHNQYLENTVASGIIGLFCLCFALFYYLTRSWKKNRLLLMGITMVFIISLVFESMFQTQLGACIFSFFILFCERQETGGGVKI